MEPELAIAERADRLPVDLDVGDEQYLLVVLLDALGAAAQRRGRLLAAAELTEIGREAKLVVLRQLLAPEHQHEMLAPGILDRPHLTFGQRLAEIDPADLRAAGRRQRRDLDVADVQHGAVLPKERLLALMLQPIAKR